MRYRVAAALAAISVVTVTACSGITRQPPRQAQPPAAQRFPALTSPASVGDGIGLVTAGTGPR